jgi:hypothetical protein
MPPRGVKSPKRKRQYKHIKASAKKRGMSEGRAEEMAARTVNKQRRQAGQTKSAKSRTSGSRKKKTGSRKGGSRKKK